MSSNQQPYKKIVEREDYNDEENLLEKPSKEATDVYSFKKRKTARIVCSITGFLLLGPIGFLLGYMIGSYLDGVFPPENPSPFVFLRIITGAAIGFVLFGPVGAFLFSFLVGKWLNNNSGKPKAPSCVCKCMLITVSLLLICVAVICAVVYGFLKDAVQDLTVMTPHDKFPTVNMTDAELRVVKDRVKLFVDDLAAKIQPTEDLVITQDEINGFIGSSNYLRGNMMVTLHQDRIEEEYSLPVEMLPGGHGRYFVGSDYMTVNHGDQTVEFKVETEASHRDWFDGPLLFAQLQYFVAFGNDKEDDDGAILELFLRNGSIFGREASQDYIERHENLLANLYESKEDTEDVLEVLHGIEYVSIEEGKIIVTPRKK